MKSSVSIPLAGAAALFLLFRPAFPGPDLLPPGFLTAAPTLAAGHEAQGEVLHLRLNSTDPAADATLDAPPAEIRLYFSEPPQMHGTSVRLADSAGELAPTTEAVADDGDAREVFIVPEAPLAPGAYTVHWRVIAQDGHAQRGDFGFRVDGGR